MSTHCLLSRTPLQLENHSNQVVNLRLFTALWWGEVVTGHAQSRKEQGGDLATGALGDRSSLCNNSQTGCFTPTMSLSVSKAPGTSQRDPAGLRISSCLPWTVGSKVCVEWERSGCGVISAGQVTAATMTGAAVVADASLRPWSQGSWVQGLTAETPYLTLASAKDWWLQ